MTSKPSAQGSRGDEDRARSALTMIQRGSFQEATALLSDLRDQYGSGHVPRMMIRILLIEACLQYYMLRSEHALDRSRRALAISNATHSNDLESESSVWHALYCFNFDRYAEFGQAILTASDGFDALSDSLRARFCLLVADGLQFFGDFRASDKWYLCARIFSRRGGDRPLMAAIEYNRIVMALSYLRLVSFLDDQRVVVDKRNWVEEIYSVQRMHMGLEIDALDELLLLGEAMARQSSGEYLISADLLETIRAKDATHICGFSERQLALEISWCGVKGGRVGSLEELDLPSLKQVSEWSYAEQVTGLRQLEDIYRTFNLSFDDRELREMHFIAINRCLSADRELRTAIEASRGMLAKVEASALGRQIV